MQSLSMPDTGKPRTTPSMGGEEMVPMVALIGNIPFTLPSCDNAPSSIPVRGS
jgi:hypothetical protein